MLPTLLPLEWLRPLRELLRSLRVLLPPHNHFYLLWRMDPWKLDERFCLFSRMGSHRELRQFKEQVRVRLVQRVVELLDSSRTFAIVRVLVIACLTPKTTKLLPLLLLFQPKA